MTPAQLEEIPKRFNTIMSNLEMNILTDIVLRVKKNKKITSTADWEIKRLSEMRGFDLDIKGYIQEALSLTQKEIDDIYNNTIEADYIRNRELYEATGVPFIPFNKNESLQQEIAAVRKQTMDTIDNITQTTALNMKVHSKTIALPMKEAYTRTLDDAMHGIISGTQTYEQVIKDVIHSMVESGIQTIDYESGVHRNMMTVTRACIMTGLTQVTGKINEMNAEKLHTDYFEVSWHATARPSHFEWQGRVYSRDQLVSVCGLGDPGGLEGVNCYHQKYPYIPGISKRLYTDEWLDEQLEKSKEKKKWKENDGSGDGKEYTPYKATQKMRKMEFLMRKQRRELSLLKKAIDGEKDVEKLKEQYTLLKCRYRATSQQYVRFANAMKLPQERARIYEDGLGRV